MDDLCPGCGGVIGGGEKGDRSCHCLVATHREPADLIYGKYPIPICVEAQGLQAYSDAVTRTLATAKIFLLAIIGAHLELEDQRRLSKTGYCASAVESSQRELADAINRAEAWIGEHSDCTEEVGGLFAGGGA